MSEWFYRQEGLVILLVLLVFTGLAVRGGHWLGRRQDGEQEPYSNHVGTMLASLLGLLALLLGFSFSLALQRHEARSDAVVVEANAIGTTYLRASLLPVELRGEAQALLRRYLDLRIRESRLSTAETLARQALLAEAGVVAARVWQLAGRAVALDPAPSRSGLFVQSVNDMIDAAGTRNDAVLRHVPGVVLLLMLLTLAMTSLTLGFVSGLGRHPVSMPAYSLLVVVLLVTHVIIDLDRPRRGAITVRQDSLLDLQRSIAEPGAETGR